MKSFLNLFSTIILAFVMGSALAMGVNINPVAAIGGAMGVSVAHGFVMKFSGADFGLMVGVNKEIWIPEIMEGFYPDNSFLSKSRDLSAFVENDVINIAEAGVDPTVLWNNAVWPIPINQRTDTNNAFTLGTLDSENTLVRNVEAMEAAYDKMASVAGQHRKAIMKAAAQRAAYAYAPADDDADDHPVFGTSGATVNGRSAIKFNDIIDLADKFNGNHWDGERILLLHSTLAAQLRKEDVTLYKSLIAQTANGFDLYGFTTFIYNYTAVYNSATGVKTAFGAAAAGTDSLSATAYLADEVFRADGSVDMFLREKDPEQRGDIIGFQKRFLAGSMRGKAHASIIQTDPA